MEWIKTWLVNLYALLALLPFISLIIFWFIFNLFYKDRKKAAFAAMDITTLFLIGSVSVMFNDIFNSNFGFWLLVLLFLIMAGLMGNFQNRIHGRVDIKKLSKFVLRVGFLILGALYILFLLIGILKYIFSV